MPQTRGMNTNRNLTAHADRALDLFHADMVNANVLDMMDDMDSADRDYSPVPAEYVGMSWSEVLDDIADYAMETMLDRFARQAIPYRWQ